MGINANFHFRLPPTAKTPTILGTQGFKKKGSLWSLKGSSPSTSPRLLSEEW